MLRSRRARLPRTAFRVGLKRSRRDRSMSASMEGYFDELATAADRALAAGERHTLGFAAEDTDFVRMNRGKVRQPGHVAQRYAEVRLIRGARHASHQLSLTGDV